MKGKRIAIYSSPRDNHERLLLLGLSSGDLESKEQADSLLEERKKLSPIPDDLTWKCFADVWEE